MKYDTESYFDIRRIVGRFTSHESDVPEFDPGFNVLCPLCRKPVGRHSDSNPIKTISFAPCVGKGTYFCATNSYFYRMHKDCYEQAPPSLIEVIEGYMVDKDPINAKGER